MSLIHPTSLAATLDSAGEEFFIHRPIASSCRKELAAIIISRQIKVGLNSGFFISFTSESPAHQKLFTGETLHTEFAHRNLTLIEAARLLILLSVDDEQSTKAIQLTERRMETMCYSLFCSRGECKPLTIAYMRYLAASSRRDLSAQLQSMLTRLNEFRDGKGNWRGFPFFYTLLMLGEVSHPLAVKELEYAAPYLAKHTSKLEPHHPYTERRRSILNSILTGSIYDAKPLLLGQFG